MGRLQGRSAANADRAGFSAGSGKVRRYAVPALALAVASTLAGFEVARLRGSARWSDARLVEASLVTGAPSPSTSDANSGLAGSPSVIDPLSQLAPQEQAEHLLERAIAHDTESLEIIGKSVDGWRGHLQNTDRLFDLVHTALNSDDLRAGSSALEIDLA